MGQLDDQQVVIIGGTSGIGLATAVRARQEGASVFAASRSADKVDACQQQHPNINFSQVDTHDRDGLAALFKSVGEIHHLVACATGAQRTMAPFMEQTEDQFKGAFDKFWGYTNVARLGIPCLAKGGSLTLVSGTPARKCNPGMSSISVTGSAVEGFVRAIALEVAPKRVNAVAPGLTATGMFGHKGLDHQEAELPEQLQKMGSGIPLGRVGYADEVALAILYCITNPYITGTVMDVDGGMLLP